MKNYFVRKSRVVLFTGLVLSVFVSGVFAQNMFRKVNDFDGDGKTDFAVTRNENGLKIWYVRQTTAGFSTIHWGISSDDSAAGDYDGDGQTDFAVYRRSSAENRCVFYILQSQTNSIASRVYPFFNANAAVHQDYDGDGKTDTASVSSDGFGGIAVYHLSATDSTGSFGVPGVFPARIGDMDGDGHADIAAYSFETGNLLRVTIIDFVTQATRNVQFGRFLDSLVPADFDGDGIGDLTIWRSSDGTWWWLRSSDNVVNATTWGVSGDFPVPGDYDGDGKTDLAIYRRASPQSQYWINGSANGVNVFTWGISTDTPVRY